jgi:pimeloyl-ACP methyl ester carboxylesterase
MKKPRRLVPAYLAAFAISIYLLPQDHAVAETLQVNGFEMHYKIIGKGEPLVLLHGFADSGESWDFLSDEFANDFQLITPDLRGHGASTNPSGQLTHRQFALDIYGLLDHLGIEKFKAMGGSSGAMTLLHMATQQAERIESMVLISASPYLTERDRDIKRSIDLNNVPEEQMRQYRKIHKHGDAQIFDLLSQFKASSDIYDDMNFTTPYLSTIKSKTYIIQGERDRYFPINVAIEMYKAIPNSFLWIVPNGSHVPTRGGNQEYFIETARSFLLGEMVPRRDKTID